jgi:hypothetical protein
MLYHKIRLNIIDLSSAFKFPVIKTYFIIGRKQKVGSTSDSLPQSFKDDFHDDSASEDESEHGKVWKGTKIRVKI